MAADPDAARHVTRHEFEAMQRYIGQLEAEQTELRKELAGVKSAGATAIEALGLHTKTGRRQAMKYGMGVPGMAALFATALSEPARADAVAADVGTQADPWRTGFFAALNAGDGQQLTDWETGFNAHAATKSSGYTTDGEHFIDVDTSAAGVTITLATADTVLGHYIVLRQNGANDLTIDTEGSENIDGSASLTLQHDQAVVVLWSDGSNWFSNHFIDTVDARTITTDQVNIGGHENIVGLETGEETITGPAANTGSLKSVSFTTNFTNSPKVVAMGDLSGTAGLTQNVRNVATTGFGYQLLEEDGDDLSASTFTFYWIAVGI